MSVYQKAIPNLSKSKEQFCFFLFPPAMVIISLFSWKRHSEEMLFKIISPVTDLFTAPDEMPYLLKAKGTNRKSLNRVGRSLTFKLN